VIPAIHPRGTNVGGLLRYLFGPGKREEHVDAHLVAAWKDAGPITDLEPPTTATGRRDVRRLTNLLEQPVSTGRNPPRKTVWHCSIRTHPTDRELSDAQWEHITGEVMAAVGLAPHGDDRAVRWVAVRHATDHVHIVATLVRQDRRTAWATNDYRKAQTACRDLEERYGLYRVAPPGTGSRRWPRPPELNKAARLKAGTVAPRERRRRDVRAAAAKAVDETDFLARLGADGVLVKLRHGQRGDVTGYAVGLAGHTTVAGDTVWYGGGRLASDLTLPRLRARWDGPSARPSGSTAARLAAESNPVPLGLYQRAADTVRQATAAMRGATGSGEASAIARAAADVLTAAARAWEGRGGGPLTDAADSFDRAAFDLRRLARPVRHPSAAGLRSIGRLIAVAGRVNDKDKDTRTVLRLILALAGIADALAEIREAQRRLHQRQAAREAASYLRSYWLPAPGPVAPVAWRRPAPAPVEPMRRNRAR
jgi:hypothetical protein